MAYRLKPHRPKKKDVRRLALDQIEKAGRTLSAAKDPVSEIHETRKCLKRLRSLLRFARASIPAKDFTREDKRYREIARTLSPLRDGHVMLTTVTHLEAMTNPHPNDAFEALRPLTAPHAPSNGVAVGHHEIIEHTLAALDDAAKAMRRLTISKITIASLASGMSKTHAHARASLQAFLRDGSCDSIHDLRKAVQHHGRHLQLVTSLWPEMFECLIGEARRLAQELGDHHDLTVLAKFVAQEADGRLTPGHAAELLAAIAARQSDLRAAAEPLARRLFSEKSARFEERITELWKAAIATTSKAAIAEKSKATPTGPEPPVLPVHH